MSEIEKQTEASNSEAKTLVAPAMAVASSSRRRLIKLGTTAAPIVATLVSKPALAWHCKSPSAWGSEILNPKTSLATNAGHQSYPDETWYISNWCDNTARSTTGNASQPWVALRAKFTALKNNAPSNKTTKTSFDYKLCTIAELQAAVAGLKVAGASPSATVKSVLTSGTDLQKSTIVAQLNYLILSPLLTNQMEKCLPSSALQQMATGSYSPSGSGQTWDAAKIKKFLYDNYMAR
ncbi:hypothetical protein [Undibacterium sp. Ren11W]|uniref:hypothetical protein n=1 Tax=Undibacterium sp. Ren11W TaxID=3413045 RepID=UPI003BF3C5C7